MFLPEYVWTGFAASVSAALFFGIYMIPQKYSGLTPIQFLLSMGVGVLLTTFPLGFIKSPVLWGTTEQILLSYSCGVAWCTGTIGYIYSIKGLGVARATCVKNTTGLWGTLFGILFLAEFSLAQPVKLLYAFLGSSCIVWATLIFTKTRAHNEDKQTGFNVWHIIGALYAAIAFAAIMIPTKQVLLGGLPLTKYLFYKGQGAFSAMLLSFLILERNNWYAWFQVKPKQHVWAISSGAMWTLGFYLIATGTTLIGLAVSWPLNQMSTHFAVLFGIITKEFDMSKYTRHIVWGLSITTVGIILLALSKT